MPSFIIVADTTARVTVAAGGGLRHFGRDAASLAGASVREAFGSWPDLVLAIERAIGGHGARAIVTAGCETLVVRCQPRDEGAATGGALVFGEVEAGGEDAIARSEARLAEAQRLAHVGSWEWDVGSNRVEWTDELFRIYGLSPGGFDGSYQAFLERVMPEDRAVTQDVVSRALETGEPFVYDHRIVRPDGGVRMLHTRGGVVKNEAGKVVRLGGACWDITELTRAAAERERARSLLEATLESTVDGLLVVDLAGRIAAYNRRLIELWNLPPAALDGADFEELLAVVDTQLEPASGAACLRRVRALQVDRSAESFDSLAFLDGRFFERYSRPQRIGDDIVGRVWSYRDVTERERLLREAQRALAIRDEFLSVVAHEIRGPLTSLHLASQGLRRDAPEAIKQRLLEIIDREGRRVARFINELVEVIRIRGGQLPFVFESVDWTGVVREVVDAAGVDAARAGSAIALVDSGPVVGNWDRNRLEQIVTNLVSNAIKFGRGRPIEVRLERDAGVARLSVRDEGIGIDPAAVPRLFNPFERAVVPQQYGGLGLGLYIVRTLVEGMGGAVRLDTVLHAGTTVTVELPIERTR
jgi:PAS domain S-box-containing protein